MAAPGGQIQIDQIELGPEEINLKPETKTTGELDVNTKPKPEDFKSNPYKAEGIFNSKLQSEPMMSQEQLIEMMKKKDQEMNELKS